LPALGVYVLAPPIIHFAHGRAGAGFGSLGIRVGMPIGGAVTGAAVGRAVTSGENCYWICEGAASGALIGVGVGLLGAVTIDAALFSYEAVKPGAAAGAASRSAKSFVITPAFGPRREGGYDVGIGGSF
jgi:hypothetical protein